MISLSAKIITNDQKNNNLKAEKGAEKGIP